jgi:hypothetical protein
MLKRVECQNWLKFPFPERYWLRPEATNTSAKDVEGNPSSSLTEVFLQTMYSASERSATAASYLLQESTLMLSVSYKGSLNLLTA